MKTPIKDFDDLATRAVQFLLQRLSYTEKTVVGYKGHFSQIKKLMIKNDIIYFSKDNVGLILKLKFGDRTYPSLSNHEKDFVSAVNKLQEFQLNGSIVLNVPPKKAPLVFSGPIGEVINSFLEYKRDKARLSKIRLNCYRRGLFSFQTFCNKKQVTSFKDVDMAAIMEYINWIDVTRPYPIYTIISTLRGFMQYVYEQKLTSINHARNIPRHKAIDQVKLPSTYTPEEIQRLLKSIDRASPVGKRNYAMIILAARLGLRASDIVRLTFEQIQWENSSLKIKQYKTGRELTLPLLADVGNALIDYLRFGRPKSKESRVFLTERPPRGPLNTSNVVTHVVQRAFSKAGIDTKNRRFGPHALRHSLSFNMLNAQTALPVITEVLGHKNTGSTKYYLRIDLGSMKQCMLEVPIVSPDFYLQKQELFYEKEF